MDQEQNRLESTLNSAQTPAELIDAHNQLAAHIVKSDASRSLTLARAAESMARSEDYPKGLATALRIQSRLYFIMGDHIQALKLANDALKLLEELQDHGEQASVLELMGHVYAHLGDYGKGLATHLKTFELYEATGDTLGQANALTNIGMAHSMAGNSRQAVEYYGRCIELYSSLGQTLRRAVALNSCCVDYAKLGDLEAAKTYGEQALNLFLQLDDQYGVGVARSSLGEVALAGKDFQEAITLFEQALTSLATLSADLTTGEALETQINLGHAHHALGNTGQALKYIRNVLAHAEQQKMQHFMMSCQQLLAQIYEQQGDFPAALGHLKRYIEVREQILSDTARREIQHLQIIHETQQAQAESERQKKLREQDRQSFERLTKIKDEFVHNATHDIKNPLTVISASVSLLEQLLPSADENVHKYITNIQKGVQKIRSLVKDILDLARLESSSTIVTEPTALHPWTESILSQFRPLAEAKQITVVSEVQPPDLTANVNKQRFGQALENLLSNALKYTPNGGQVRLCASRKDAQIQIEVSNNGIGIPKHAIPNLFDRFYRVDNHEDEIEGTGLGLSIVKLSVEHHGGTIAVKSKVGKGTTFTILLP